jgi:hypothetical protein
MNNLRDVSPIYFGPACSTGEVVDGVYLLHFNRPFGSGKKYIKHYIGYSSDIYARLCRQRSGQGCNLLRAMRGKVGWQCVRVWKGGDRQLEKRLKARKNAAKLCPICIAIKQAQQLEEEGL